MQTWNSNDPYYKGISFHVRIMQAADKITIDAWFVFIKFKIDRNQRLT